MTRAAHELTPFISEDPIGLNSGDGTNFFAYVANNPVSRIDPFGLASCREECIREAAEKYRLCRDDKKKEYDEEIDRINGFCWGPALILPRCWRLLSGNYWDEAKGNYCAELSRCRRDRIEKERRCKTLPPCGRSGGC
jgi:uncharacterized protein RhaS with RHS repeats